MARLIEITATTSGIHYLEFGFEASEDTEFAIQMYITKYGKHVIDWCQAMGLGFITFLEGDVWVHNSPTAARCNLYGEKRDFIVGVVSNEQPNIIKLYDAVGIHTDSEWAITEITIPATLNYPTGMYSKIPSGRFKRRGGVWRAEFLRNMGSSAGSAIDAINGEPLKGYEIYMKLKNTSDEQVRLFKVDVAQTSNRG